MKLLLLLAFTTLIMGSIKAVILSETQHITNELDKQITELNKARDLNESLSAAAEYFKAPQSLKKKLKSKAKESFAATAEYFKAPNVSELQSNALTLEHERLPPAAEYLRANDYLKRSSRRKVGNALATAAEYFQASELPNHHRRVDRVAESLAAAAEYLRAPELPKRSSRTKVGNALAIAAEYIKEAESPRHQKRVDRVAESLAAAAEYLRAPEYPKRDSRIESDDTRAVTAEYFKSPELPKLNIRSVRAA